MAQSKEENAAKATLIPQINIPTLKGVVEHIMFGRNKVPMIYGGFGVGKTEAITQACEEMGAVICDVRLGQQETVDLRGFPGVDRKTGQTIWYAPSMLPFIGNDQWPDDVPIGLILDEINQGTPSVLGGAYQLVNERRYGEHVLKPNVRIIAMGNREVDRGVVNRMPLPLLNRMVQFELIVDVQAFAEYAMSQGIPTWLIAFWLFRSDLVNTFNPDKPEKVIATPRTWFMFADFISDASIPTDVRDVACMGAVGKGPAIEALGYQEIYDKVPTLKEIISNPTGTKVPHEPSMEYAVCIKLASSMTSKNVTPLYTYLKRMQPTFTVLGWTLAGKRDQSLLTTNEFIDFGQRYRDAFSANV
jgi:hypothetical protein